MKIHCFYLYMKAIDPKKFYGIHADTIMSTEEYDYSLYAFTPEKESVDYFKSTRNMNLFFEKIIEIDRGDYEDFCEEHKDHLLEYHAFQTKKYYNKIVIQKMVEVLCTTLEADCILYYSEEKLEQYITDALTENLISLHDRKAFKKPILKILNKVFIMNDLINVVYPSEEIPFSVYDIDELGLYCKMFSNTFINMRG